MIVHGKPSRLGTALSATSMRLALGFTWFLACAYSGGQLIVGAVKSHFRLVSISLPLVILLWVILFFCGRWLLGLLADRVSSQLTKESGTEAERNPSALGSNVPQVETGHIIPTGAFFLDPSTVMLNMRYAMHIPISRMFVPDTLEALSNLNLKYNMPTKAGFTPPVEVTALQPCEADASAGGLTESSTNAPETPMVATRHSARVATVSYLGRPLWGLAPLQRSRISRRSISISSAAFRPNFTASRANNAPTMGVPERDFTPELPRSLEKLSHPQA